MGKLVEATHVTLGGEVGTNDWAFPYLDEQHSRYAMELLTEADGLLLGRRMYEGLSVAYTRMADEAPAGVPAEFIDRMNSIPKFVAWGTLSELTWNATAIDGEVASFVDDLKRNAGQSLLKYGNGPLDATLMEHALIDEFHLFLTPSRSARATTCSRASIPHPISASSKSPRDGSGTLQGFIPPVSRTPT